MTELNNEAQLSINDDATAENTAEAHIEEVFSHSAAKMREKGMSETAINQFRMRAIWISRTLPARLMRRLRTEV